MKIKWQWFLGGRVMFWISIVMFLVAIIGFTLIYIVDITTLLTMKVQNIDEISIRIISEKYVESLRY